MSIKDSIASFFQGLHEAPHGYKPSLTIFQEINVSEVARLLKLDERAVSRAQDDEPALGSSSFDAVENEIIDVIESVKSRDRQSLSDQLEILADRLASLNFEGRLGDIDLGVRKAEAAFQRIVDSGMDRLHALRRSLLEHERSLQHFRIENGRQYPADFPSVPKKVFLIGVIAFLWLIETLGNTAFLAKGNELGPLGAYTESIVISTLNLGGAFFLAKLCTNLIHVRKSKMFIGALGAIGYLALLLVINLLVAHYREVSGVFFEQGGAETMARAWNDPIGLKEFQSWILFGMGCLFSIISFIDSIYLNDPYPGYGARAQALEQARTKYLEEKELHTDQLGEELSEAVELLRNAKHDLARWRLT